MFLQRYPVRTGPRSMGTPGSRSANGLLAPPAVVSRGRSHSASATRTPSVSRNISRARSPLSQTVNQASDLGDRTQAVASGPRSASPDDSLDEPISAGVRRRRSPSTDGSASLAFSPALTKRLKLYAMKVAAEKGVPEEQLFEFVDASFHSMLSRFISDSSLDWRNCLYAHRHQGHLDNTECSEQKISPPGNQRINRIKRFQGARV